MSLQRGQHVPFFEVATVEGTRASYRDLWQRRTLLLLSVPPGPDDAREFSSLGAQLRERVSGGAEVVVTTEAVEGLPQPGALVADRWGEIHHVGALDESAPDPEALAEWVDFVQMHCPECEGETR